MPFASPTTAVARVHAEGDSGIRHIRIRDFNILNDLGPECACFDLGPTPFEMQLGALGSCLIQSFLVNAAAQGIVLDHIEVEVTGELNSLEPGADTFSHDVRYTVHLNSNAATEEISALKLAVERHSRILNLLVQPQSIQGTIVHDIGPVADLVASEN